MPTKPQIDFKAMLKTLCEDPRRELEFVDLLSQLEFVGCRKIVKSVGFDGVTYEVLQHISEEASHAFLLKSLVEKAGLKRRSWLEAPLSELGWRYFRELDERVSRLQEDARAHYPAVSWVVERRVLELYPDYLSVTRNPGVKRVLTRILAQERRHAGQFNDLNGQVHSDWFRDRAIAIEAELWARFCEELQAWLSDAPPTVGPPSPYPSSPATVH